MTDRLSDSGRFRAAMCRACADVPTGVAGHAGLALYGLSTTRPGPVAIFKCMHCGAEWSRDYAGQGTFSWMLERIPSGDEVADSRGLTR